MDPLAPQAASLVNAVQALLVRQGAAGSALTALLGQDVEVLFQGLTPGGVKLQLPSGQTMTAQGELPYPEGTQLRVRILPAAPGEAGLRLQLQEARPPAPRALLAPLIQSEAASLAARLTEEPPPPELAPLVRLLAVLTDAQPKASLLPSPGLLQEALRELPGPLLSRLGQVLGEGGMASIQELATSLQAFLQDPSPTLPTETRRMEVAGDKDKDLQTLVQQVILRFQSLSSQHPELPAGDKDALVTWIRNLLHKAAAEPPQPAPPGPRPDSGRPAGTAEALIPAKLLIALQSHAGSKADVPEAWESWIRGTTATLSDPAASPREAAFHALQAKEGTAFLEIPLPWAQASPLQIWVESDAPEARRNGGDATKRVLLGLKFSQLGETRLGLAQRASGLQIRVWTEHPEALEGQKERLKQELEELGKTVDLKIYALTNGPDGSIPTVRSLVVGPSLSALG